jgi:hypothetical protein
MYDDGPLFRDHYLGGTPMDIPGKLLGIDAAAIAIDASQIKGVLQPPHHREYRMTLAAAYLLTLLVVIVVYSAFVLMPGQSRSAVAAEILFVSVAGVAYLCGWCLPRLAGLAVFSADLVIRWIAGVTGLLLGIAAGISLLTGNGGGLYFLAFGALLLIANEVASAWSLIVGIGKDTGAKDITLGQQPAPEGPPAGQLAAEENGSRAVPEQ